MMKTSTEKKQSFPCISWIDFTFLSPSNGDTKWLVDFWVLLEFLQNIPNEHFAHMLWQPFSWEHLYHIYRMYHWQHPTQRKKRKIIIILLKIVPQRNPSISIELNNSLEANPIHMDGKHLYLYPIHNMDLWHIDSNYRIVDCT